MGDWLILFFALVLAITLMLWLISGYEDGKP